MANNLATTGSGHNALQITQQYPAERFNLLVPMQTVAEIADIHKPVMNVVQISTNPADKEIYEQERARRNGRAGTGSTTRPSPQGGRSRKRASTSSCGRRASRF